MAVRSVHSSATHVTGELRAIDTPGAGRHGQFTAEKRAWAANAWKYFQQNTDSATGMVEANEGTAQVTMWSAADSLAAIVIARDFHLISGNDARMRLRAVLQFLNTMELFHGDVPNTLYSGTSGKKINAKNEEHEVGWSTVDMGRLLIWLRAVREEYAPLAPFVDQAVLRWSLCDAVTGDGGLRSGGWDAKGQLITYDEGNVGYQEYAALGFKSWGFDVRKAATLEPREDEKIEGKVIPRDAEDPRVTGHTSPVDSIPAVLEGLEFGWAKAYPDDNSPQPEDLARLLFQVQELRWKRTGLLTARSSHFVPNPPYFVHDSIFVDGYAWNTVTAAGEYRPQDASINTAAALGMWTLWPSSYTDVLMRQVRDAMNPEHGWYEGIGEQSGGVVKAQSSSTNAAVLEALDYYVHGPRFGAGALLQAPQGFRGPAPRDSTCKVLPN